MGKYFTTTIKPVLPVAGQIQSNKTDLVFGGADVLFDWNAFEIPRGTARLIDVTVAMRGGQTVKGIDLFFAKTDPDGSTAPGSIGTVNAAADGTGYYRNLIGTVHMATGSFKEDLSNMVIGSLGHGAGTGQVPSVVLEGVTDSGTSVGYDKIYIAGTVSAGSGYNFSTGVLANAGVGAGAAKTFVTKTVDPRLFFDIGDVVHVHDSDTAIGTVASLTDNDIVLTDSTGVAISTNDEIINASPFELILSFEK